MLSQGHHIEVRRKKQAVFFHLPVCFRDAAKAESVSPRGLESLTRTPAASLINSSINALGDSASIAILFPHYSVVD